MPARILVVDDDPLAAELICEILRSAGMDASFLTSSTEAAEAKRERGTNSRSRVLFSPSRNQIQRNPAMIAAPFKRFTSSRVVTNASQVKDRRENWFRKRRISASKEFISTRKILQILPLSYPSARPP